MNPYGFSCENGTILVLSDLHFGDKSYQRCPSREANLERMLERRLPHMQHVVLNGDIIGTILADDHNHFESCLAQIANWMRQAPNAQFHYILGNHDMTAELVHAIKERFPEGSNLKVVDVWARCGDVFFTHGDYGDRNEARKDVPANQRQLLTAEETRIEHAGYYANPNRRNLVFSDMKSKNPDVGDRVRKACAPFDELGLLDGISAVMIGHTHRTLYGYPYETKSGEAIQVYNTGGLITGANFMPMEIDMGENGKVARHDDGRLKIQPIRGQLHILDTPSR